MSPLSPQKLRALKEHLHRLNPVQKQEVLELIEEMERRQTVKKAKLSLLAFVQFVDPGYLVGEHHKRLAAMLEDLAFGRKTRIAVNIAPRFGKSHLVSFYFPAWFLGNYPDQKVMMVSHTADLAVDFGRKVRNLIASERYREIFGGTNGGKDAVELSQDSKSAGRWHTNHGGEYFAVGVGGAIAGRGADLLLIDDPHNEQDIINGNLEVFDRAYEWFTTGARTRLMPGGRVAVVQCMTGDTPVLMSSGVEKPLRDVRPGDMVASFDNGCLVTSKVLNWASNGSDCILTLRTTSGVTVQANGRHPFLVQTGTGELQWERLQYLQPGETVVRTAPASGGARSAFMKDVGGRLLQSISDFTTDQIASITPSGVAEVFDIQIERTENFIANGLVSHNTRWATNDLTGRLVKNMVMNEAADQYEVVEFPAILEKEVELVDETGETHVEVKQLSLWPEKWSLEALLQTKASMPAYQWSAQYMQNPVSEEGAIVKREWWRVWEDDTPPFCNFIIQSWDTAFEKHNRADFSACTTWGVWYPEKDPHDNPTGVPNVILLDSFKDRMEFPELKKVALEHYNRWNTETTPVSLIVEKKASGAPLIYELRAMGIPVQEYTPSKGQDKIARLHSVSDFFASGVVWAPQTRWAEELVNEVAEFPAGEHDDLVDATTLALMRFRQGGFMRLPSDEKDPVRKFRRNRNQGYY